ncbi:MAG: hypothetical protein Kow0069_19210 [Promethearchaeota archaeon]
MVNYFPPNTGAAAVNAFEIANRLAAAGHEILVRAPRTMGAYFNVAGLHFSTREGVNTARCPLKFPGRTTYVLSHVVNALLSLRSTQKRGAPEIVLTQYHPFHLATPAGLVAGRALGVPVVARSHDLFLDLESWGALERAYGSVIHALNFAAARAVDRFFCPTPELAQHLLSTGRIRAEKVGIHRNGVDTTLFRPEPNDEVKARYGCEHVLYFVGGLQPDVGLHNFLNAVARLAGDVKDFVVLVVGDGPSKGDLLSLARKLEIAQKVKFLGSIPHDQLPKLVNGMDVGVGRTTQHPMHRYVAPVKCLEYMACGKPFVTTPVSEEVIKDDDTGLLLKTLEPAHVAERVRTLFEDRALAREKGRVGLARARELFDWGKVMVGFEKELTELVK